MLKPSGLQVGMDEDKGAGHEAQGGSERNGTSTYRHPGVEADANKNNDAIAANNGVGTASRAHVANTCFNRRG